MKRSRASRSAPGSRRKSEKCRGATYYEERARKTVFPHHAAFSKEERPVLDLALHKTLGKCDDPAPRGTHAQSFSPSKLRKTSYAAGVVRYVCPQGSRSCRAV